MGLRGDLLAQQGLNRETFDGVQAALLDSQESPVSALRAALLAAAQFHASECSEVDLTQLLTEQVSALEQFEGQHGPI